MCLRAAFQRCSVPPSSTSTHPHKCTSMLSFGVRRINVPLDVLCAQRIGQNLSNSVQDFYSQRAAAPRPAHRHDHALQLHERHPHAAALAHTSGEEMNDYLPSNTHECGAGGGVSPLAELTHATARTCSKQYRYIQSTTDGSAIYGGLASGGLCHMHTWKHTADNNSRGHHLAANTAFASWLCSFATVMAHNVACTCSNLDAVLTFNSADVVLLPVLLQAGSSSTR